MSPVVSIIIANYNGGRFVRDSLLSATRQTLRDIEILFVDDASTDGSLALAQSIAREDARIRVIALDQRSGPGNARNAGLAAASGRWISVLDSDDMMHPERLESLVAEMQRSQAEICADDLLVFQDGKAPKTLLSRPERTPRWVTTSEFILSNRLFSSSPPLGYLKPLFDRAFLRTHAILYNPTLPIGEDFDFVLQQLLCGARYRLVGALGYFYRRHQLSTSHRISAADLERLLLADDAMDGRFDATQGAITQARQKRRASIERALSYTHIISALKSRDWLAAAKLAARHPNAIPLLRLPVMARLRRLVPDASDGRQSVAEKQAVSEKRVCLISRQRIIGNTNGSSAYLLSICNALRANGFKITLISPNPATFGRWPFLYFRSEMGVFDEVSIRGSWPIGRRLFLATNPRIYLAAAFTVVEMLLMRLGIVQRSRVKPAAYAIAAPWTRDDQIFIARHAPPSSSVVIADYAFLTPGIPYALCPAARSLVVMHDLFCSRGGKFEGVKASDSVSALDEASEIALLGQADAVVAIQAKEASFVAERLPQRRVILAPMAVTTTDAPQPGDSRTVLFVGSNTAPNVLGLRWFLEHAWPDVRRAIPGCSLLVAGTVPRAVSHSIEGVRHLGLVPDLQPLYRMAGVVISPLIVGSGLKIKLIEALSNGKAIVATSVTVEGVEDATSPAVTVTDDAHDFADAIARLLRDDDLRNQKCREALAVAKRRFSAEACYSGLLEFISQPRSVNGDQISATARSGKATSTNR